MQSIKYTSTLKNGKLDLPIIDLPEGTIVEVILLVQDVESKPINLLSDKNINYQELEQLLKSKQWRKADELTSKIMCMIMDREEKGMLNVEHMNNFHCQDLRTINELWVNNSNGKFGFSVQKELLLSLGGTIDKNGDGFDYDIWKKFGAKTDWLYQTADWKTHEDFMRETNDGQSALRASLPYKVCRGLGIWCISSLPQRLIDCNI